MPDLLQVKGLTASYGATQVLFDVDFTLAAATLTGVGSDTLTGIETVNLAAGAGHHLKAQAPHDQEALSLDR